MSPDKEMKGNKRHQTAASSVNSMGILLVLIVSVLLAATSTARAGIEEWSNVKVSPPLQADGDVSWEFAQSKPEYLLVSPDSKYVVFLADATTDEQYELFSAPSDGQSPAVRLNEDLLAGTTIEKFAIDANGTGVLFVATHTASGIPELYRTPIGGGAATRLNPPLPPWGAVSSFALSPDGERIVFNAKMEKQVFELYSMPATGGTAAKLSGFLPEGAGGYATSDFAISPDSSRVVFRVVEPDSGVKQIFNLFSAAIDGSQLTQLNPPLTGFKDVFSFAISPDSSWVVYLSDQNVNGIRELFSVPISGGTPLVLNGPLFNGKMVTDFVISPDSSRVVYRANEDNSDAYELYSVPMAGGPQTKLNGQLIAGGDVGYDFVVTPDSNHVIFTAENEMTDVLNLFSAPLTGGPETSLSGPLNSKPGVLDFALTPSGKQVIFQARLFETNATDIYRVAVAGGSFIQRLNEPPANPGGITSFAISPSGSHVAYRTNQDSSQVYELYLKSLGSEPAIKLNGPLVPDGGVTNDFRFGPNGLSVVYRADQDVYTKYELYVSSTASPTAPSYLPMIVR